MSSKVLSTEADEIRCLDCNKLLAIGDNFSYDIKCIRCGKLNTILSESEDQVIITDPEGYIIYANNRVQDMTGYKLEEIIGKKPSIWGGNMPKAFYVKMWDDIKNKKKSISVYVNNTRKDGVKYKARLKISPMFNDSGDIKMYVGIETIISS